MQKNPKTKLQIDVNNFEAKITLLQPEIQNQLIPLLKDIKQSVNEMVEALRLANVCLIYKVNQDKFEYFKSLFYRQTKKIYLDSSS